MRPSGLQCVDTWEELSSMRVLITGIQGFIGWRLSEFLKSNGFDVAGVRRPGSKSPDIGTIEMYDCDMVDAEGVKNLLRRFSPSTIFHLAAQSLPSVSWQEPEKTLQVNLIGALNLLKGVQALQLNVRTVMFGSSSEYAPSMEPIPEDSPLKPSSPYALSKIASSLLAGLYHEAFNLDVIIVRPFFIIGPRKTGDVCSSFARGIVQVERGNAKALKVGNLNAVRDFLDIEDAVRAIRLIREKGEPCAAYNISSGTGTPVSEILEILTSKASTAIPVEKDESASRPLDNPIAVGNNQKLRSFGWAPTIGLEESLSRILDYWRNVT